MEDRQCMWGFVRVEDRHYNVTSGHGFPLSVSVWQHVRKLSDGNVGTHLWDKFVTEDARNQLLI